MDRPPPLPPLRQAGDLLATTPGIPRPDPLIEPPPTNRPGTLKILLLGGYGVFGGRLAELLSNQPEIELLICGRTLPRAQAFCASYRGQAQTRPLALDRQDIAEALRAHRPGLVIDASGPFQAYGPGRYSVIEACIAARTDYLDFADAADFVAGVAQFDASARTAGIVVLSGLSSFPALTAAVLREMAKTMDIVAVEGGVAPSPHAGIGLNVMRAITEYAGAPVKLWRDGRPAHAIALAESRRFTIAVPGRMPLRNIRFSLVDVPDLQLIPPEHPTMTDIWMGAGPVPEIFHRILNLAAKARAQFGLPSLAPLAPLIHAILNRLATGEHRGGMFVHARGTAGGQPVQQSWHLLAEGSNGPYIPSMAAAAVIRKLLAGTRPAAGARSAVRALDLADYTAQFQGRAIFTGVRREEPGAPLYRQILGPAFGSLPPRLQELHGTAGPRQWTGQAEVRRGTSPLARIIGAIIGFPPAAPQVPVTVTFTPKAGAESWTRSFGGKAFTSVQSSGTGRNQALLVERFGRATIALALVVEGARLRLIPRRWSLAGIPMPGFLCPAGTTFETEEHGQFRFDVEITVPLAGLIVAYRGTLHPEPPA